MRVSSLTKRVAPATDQPGNDPWEVHSLALQRIANGEDIVVLSIGQESEEVTPEVIVDAAIKSLRDGHHHYSEVAGQQDLLEAIADYHEKLSGQRVSSDNCVVYSGAQNALFALSQVLLEPGDEVVLSEPYYTTYKSTFSITGAKIISVPLLATENYQLNVDHILESISPQTQMIVLNSPNNPMGFCYDELNWQRLIDVCVEKQIWLVHDAVYADIVDQNTLFMPQKLNGAAEVLLTVGSLSKSHRMTGWRLGWVVAPKAIAIHLANLSMCMHYGLPPFIMDAAISAIRSSAETPRVIEKLLQSRRDQLMRWLKALPAGVGLDSGSGMFILLDVSHFGLSAHEFSMELLKNNSVSVLPCDGFGAAGQYLVRVGLCVDDEHLDRAGEAIITFCKTL